MDGRVEQGDKVAFSLGQHNPDVLTCIANLSNDEVFTPPAFAGEMLDTLADAWAEEHGGRSIWSDPTVTFLDPFTKSGVFLREITKRLVDGLAEQIPDLQQRVDHILTQQVFGIGITQLTALLARRSVYCSKNATGEHSIATGFDRPWGNIWYERTEHTWVNRKRVRQANPLTGDDEVVEQAGTGRCKYCGASEAEYSRDQMLETHAYAFIHTDDIASRLAEIFGANVHFDVIIGNPPYQMSDGGAGASAAPIYDRFVSQAKALNPRFLTMVIPARWYAGGKGLNEFRADMLRDRRIKSLDDFPDTTDVFPNVNNRGGICYFLWARDHQGDVEVRTHSQTATVSTAVRPLLEPGLDTFIRFNEGVEILRKVVHEESHSESISLSLPKSHQFAQLVSARNPFGLATSFKGSQKAGTNSMRVFRNGGICFAKPEDISGSTNLIDSFKLFVSRASPGSDDYPHLVLSKPIIGEPRDIATDTYVAIGPFQSRNHAENAAEYMSTRFFRFMLSLLRVSLNVTRTVYSLAPMQDFSRTWSDDDLAVKYRLSSEDREFMGRIVKPVSWAGSFSGAAETQVDDNA
jgi:site-specific DNA-methyltransferase (adenine-specific)